VLLRGGGPLFWMRRACGCGPRTGKGGFRLQRGVAATVDCPNRWWRSIRSAVAIAGWQRRPATSVARRRALAVHRHPQFPFSPETPTATAACDGLSGDLRGPATALAHRPVTAQCLPLQRTRRPMAASADPGPPGGACVVWSRPSPGLTGPGLEAGRRTRSELLGAAAGNRPGQPGQSKPRRIDSGWPAAVTSSGIHGTGSRAARPHRLGPGVGRVQALLREAISQACWPRPRLSDGGLGGGRRPSAASPRAWRAELGLPTWARTAAWIGSCFARRCPGAVECVRGAAAGSGRRCGLKLPGRLNPASRRVPPNARPGARWPAADQALAARRCWASRWTTWPRSMSRPAQSFWLPRLRHQCKSSHFHE